MDDSKDDKKDGGKLLTFPGGKKVDPVDIGVDSFVLGPSGHIPTPELIDPSDIEREIRERSAFVNGQELVKVLDQKGSTSEIIDVLLKEIAEETSHIKFEREKAISQGKSALNQNMARVATLRTLTEILLKRKDSDLAERLDLKSPRFQKIFKVWMEFFYSSMEKSGIESEIIDLVFKQMQADMLEWEKKMDATG